MQLSATPCHRHERWRRLALKWLRHSLWNGFEVVVLLWSVASSVSNLLGAHVAASSPVFDALQLGRALRLVRLVLVWDRTRVLLGHLGAVVPIAAKYAVVYVCVTYSFAVLAIRFFGFVPPCTDDDDGCPQQDYSFTRYVLGKERVAWG